MSQLFKFQEIQTKYKQNTNKIQTKYKIQNTKKTKSFIFDEIHQREVSKSPSQKCPLMSQNITKCYKMLQNDTFYQNIYFI